MSNWMQRLEHTAEHTPGPWMLEGPCGEWAWKYRVAVYDRHDDSRTLCTINPTAGAQVSDEEGHETHSDPEQEATARLIAAAPEMLRLLAEYATLAPGSTRRGDAEGINPVDLHARTIGLLSQHCRIGVGPPDVLSTAATSEESEPPPAPEACDEID